MAQDVRQGVTTALSVDTAKALAELRLVAQEADRVRASLAGLPPPAAGAAASASPLLPRMPVAALPGGRGGAAQARANVRAAETLRDMRREAAVMAGSRPVHVPAGPAAAAESRARSGSFLLTPGASQSAQSDAWSKHRVRALRSFDEGFKMESEGVRLGAFGLGREGVSLRAAWSRMLGPAMGYAAVAHGGLKLAEAVSQTTLDAIDESARTGVPVGEVLKTNIFQQLHNAGVNAIEGGGAIVGATRTVLAGAAAGIALLADRPDLAEEIGLKAQVAKQAAADFFARLRGMPDTAANLAALDSERNATITVAINESRRQAEKDAQRVAEQLAGLGFPGTLDQLKGEVRGTIYDAKYVPQIEAVADEYAQREARLRNGVQE